MSEKQGNQEKRKGPAFSIESGGNKYEFRPDNSQLHLYSEMPEADHFRLRGQGSLFRGQLSNFDSLAYFAENNGYKIFPEIRPDDETYKVFVARFGAPELPPLDELMPRKERQVKFGMYLLEHEIVTPESFRDGTL